MNKKYFFPILIFILSISLGSSDYLCFNSGGNTNIQVNPQGIISNCGFVINTNQSVSQQVIQGGVGFLGGGVGKIIPLTPFIYFLFLAIVCVALLIVFLFYKIRENRDKK